MGVQYDDLVNPDDVVLLDDGRLALQVPDYLVKIVREYDMLDQHHSYLMPYLRHGGKPIPFDELARMD